MVLVDTVCNFPSPDGSTPYFIEISTFTDDNITNLKKIFVFVSPLDDDGFHLGQVKMTILHIGNTEIWQLDGGDVGSVTLAFCYPSSVLSG